MTSEQIDKCHLIFSKYGSSKQILKAIEELAELTQELVKFQLKEKPNFLDCDQVCSEIADVLILCQQMILFFGEREVHAAIELKLNRQLERMGIASGFQKKERFTYGSLDSRS